MTIDDLIAVFDDAHWAAHSRRAGVVAIVRALRDEMAGGTAWHTINEILGDAGEKKPDAAPAVCEWTRDFEPFAWTACSGEQRIEKGVVACPSCGKPIKFTEAK